MKKSRIYRPLLTKNVSLLRAVVMALIVVMPSGAALSRGSDNAAAAGGCPAGITLTNGVCTVKFLWTGKAQFFTVPTGVTAMTMDVLAASGGSGLSIAVHGGWGGEEKATVPVTPGQNLTIIVGGWGSYATCDNIGNCATTPGGYGGGGAGGPNSGGGGGGSFVFGPGNQLLIAAGGGGGMAAGYQEVQGGNGGGTAGGTAGTDPPNSDGATGGGGATTSGPGKGGANGVVIGGPCAGPDGYPGTDGTGPATAPTAFGTGGPGTQPYSGAVDCGSGWSSGGGGGGYYGGGSGGGGLWPAGGGGGSGYLMPQATDASSGIAQSEPQVDISLPPQPQLSIGDVTVDKPLKVDSTADFPVTLSASSTKAVTVDYATVDGTAKEGTGYVKAKGTLSFPPGTKSETIQVTVKAGIGAGPPLTYTVNLSNPANATIASGTGTGTINEAPTLSVDDVTVKRGDPGTHQATFTVSLDRPTSEAVHASYTTMDGTAKVKVDYAKTTGSLLFAPGTQKQKVQVPVLANPDATTPLDFTLNLTKLTPKWVIPGKLIGTATLVPGPIVTSVKADSGPVSGNTRVMVLGAGFAPDDRDAVTSVDFAPTDGSASVAARSFRVLTDGSLTAVTPEVTGSLPASGKKGDKSLETDVTVTTKDGTSPTSKKDLFTFDPVSVVQLGDSVASGEGTLYGYHYDSSTGVWSGGALVPPWAGPYPLCHDSPYAYGQVVTDSLPDAKFTQLACTGANYQDGIINQEADGATQYRPPELGTLAAPDPQYVKAKPDVVLVTLGADDIHFATIVKDCLINAANNILTKGKVSLKCTATNPGPSVQTHALDVFPTMPSNYEALAAEIQSLGDAASTPKEPKIIFTDYMDPLPPGGRTCADTLIINKVPILQPTQLTYLDHVLNTMNTIIKTTVTGLEKSDPNVSLVDISKSFSGHTWCTSDPWDYGLSVYYPTDLKKLATAYFERDKSGAPFHPTPKGQSVIAGLVAPEVNRLLAQEPPDTTAVKGLGARHVLSR